VGKKGPAKELGKTKRGCRPHRVERESEERDAGQNACRSISPGTTKWRTEGKREPILKKKKKYTSIEEDIPVFFRTHPGGGVVGWGVEPNSFEMKKDGACPNEGENIVLIKTGRISHLK